MSVASYHEDIIISHIQVHRGELIACTKWLPNLLRCTVDRAGSILRKFAGVNAYLFGVSALAHLFAKTQLRVRSGGLSKAIRDLWIVGHRFSERIQWTFWRHFDHIYCASAYSCGPDDQSFHKNVLNKSTAAKISNSLSNTIFEREFPSKMSKYFCIVNRRRDFGRANRDVETDKQCDWSTYICIVQLEF